MSIAISLHLLGVIVWVGGMFFAHMALRPAANEILEPPQRMKLMLRVFDRFFRWVWAAVILILATGFWIFFGQYQGQGGWSVHAMTGIGVLMALLFAFIWFAPYRQMRAALEQQDFSAAAGRLATIGRIVAGNLTLGLIAAVVGVAGRYI